LRIALISMYDQGTHGHRSLSAVLKQSGVEVHNIFFGDKIIQDVPTVSERELQAVEHLVRNIQPDLVGLSITSMLCHPPSVAVSQRIKDTLDVPIIFGGPYSGLLPEFCLKNAPIDYVAIGEAEESLLEVCQRIAAGKNADDVAGIMSRRTMTYIRRDPPENLDALPNPDIEDGPGKYLVCSADGAIVERDPYYQGGSYCTKCSRNCPFNCSFCSAPNVRQLASPGMSLRRRSVGRIIEELKHALAANPTIGTIGFWDDTFPAEANWLAEFAAAYKKEIHLPFHIWAHPKTVKEANIAALAGAGLKGVILGIESACEETRKKVFLRPESNDEIVKVDAILHKYGVERAYDLIVDHQWESPTELADTFELVSRLQSPFKVNMHSLILFPETQLAQRAIREGLAKDQGEIIQGIFADLNDSRQKFQWVRQVPVQRDLGRAYWVFLILCLGNPKIPTRLVKFLSRVKLLRRHPELLTDAQVIDMRKENDEFGLYVMSLYRRSAMLSRVFRALPWFEKTLDGALKRSTSFAIFSYLAHRMLARVPGFVVRRLRPQAAA
jgi:anaerobic magnesium-protoporphyrin IX monomethyl ester cyclase